MGTTSEGYVMRMIKNGKHETMKIKYSKYKRMRLNMLKISKQVGKTWIGLAER